MVKVIKKEMEFLNTIIESDFSECDEGRKYIITDYSILKLVRKLIPSLNNKGIIAYYVGLYDCSDDIAWISIDPNYQDKESHKLINLEVA